MENICIGMRESEVASKSIGEAQIVKHMMSSTFAALWQRMRWTFRHIWDSGVTLEQVLSKPFRKA